MKSEKFKYTQVNDTSESSVKHVDTPRPERSSLARWFSVCDGGECPGKGRKQWLRNYNRSGVWLCPECTREWNTEDQ